MNRPRDLHVPASAWADTQRIVPQADLGAPATQIVGDRDAYLGGQGDVGRRIGEDQVELFITGDVAGALQREFQAHASEFIALHDVGSSGSLRLLGSLAGSAGARVQRLSVRRQGHGLALAVLQFVEVPLADGQRLRVYSTDINADGPARQQVARVLLAFSQLGVLMVGDLPLHADHRVALDAAVGLQRRGRQPCPQTETVRRRVTRGDTQLERIGDEARRLLGACERRSEQSDQAEPGSGRQQFAATQAARAQQGIETSGAIRMRHGVGVQVVEEPIACQSRMTGDTAVSTAFALTPLSAICTIAGREGRFTCRRLLRRQRAALRSARRCRRSTPPGCGWSGRPI
jgi:hypothetical protein